MRIPAAWFILGSYCQCTCASFTITIFHRIFMQFCYLFLGRCKYSIFQCFKVSTWLSGCIEILNVDNQHGLFNCEIFSSRCQQIMLVYIYFSDSLVISFGLARKAEMCYGYFPPGSTFWMHGNAVDFIQQCKLLNRSEPADIATRLMAQRDA